MRAYCGYAMPIRKNHPDGSAIGGNAITLPQTSIGDAAISTSERTSCRTWPLPVRGSSSSAAGNARHPSVAERIEPPWVPSAISRPTTPPITATPAASGTAIRMQIAPSRPSTSSSTARVPSVSSTTCVVSRRLTRNDRFSVHAVMAPTPKGVAKKRATP